MAALVPQAVEQSVAFEIPLPKKDLSDSPPVQKRLAEYANSPRKQPSLNDISKKLTEASKRRDDIMNDTKSKTSSHNAEVKKIHKKSIKRNDEVLESREKKLNSKLGAAGVKREEDRLSWVRKLSQTTRNKLNRGKKSLQEADLAAHALEARIEIKEIAAELRRADLTNKKVEELALINDSKIRRGKLAIDLASVEAKYLENKIEEQNLSARHRREMKNILTSVRISESAADKKEKATDVLKRQEEYAKVAAKKIEAKLALAQERKENGIAEQLEKLSTKANDKMRRGAESVTEKETEAKMTAKTIEDKLNMASQRREQKLREQQQQLQKASAKKEARVASVGDDQEKAARVMQNAIQSKLLTASARKEHLLASKVHKVTTDAKKKEDRATMAHYKSLEDASKLNDEIITKLKEAAQRKDKITQESAKILHCQNMSKVCDATLLFYVLFALNEQFFCTSQLIWSHILFFFLGTH